MFDDVCWWKFAVGAVISSVVVQILVCDFRNHDLKAGARLVLGMLGGMAAMGWAIYR